MSSCVVTTIRISESFCITMFDVNVWHRALRSGAVHEQLGDDGHRSRKKILM